jgi:hypothetical protein
MWFKESQIVRRAKGRNPTAGCESIFDAVHLCMASGFCESGYLSRGGSPCRLSVSDDAVAGVRLSFLEGPQVSGAHTEHLSIFNETFAVVV